jgi:hypothetical protein
MLVDPQHPYRDVILIPPAVYFLFTLINFQAGRDLIPFFPFAGLFAGYVFVGVDRVIRSARFFARIEPRLGISWVPQVAAAGIMLVALYRGGTYRIETWAIKDQDSRFTLISQALEKDDKIYVHGTTEILVLLNRPNLNPYILLDWGADSFAASMKPGGFQQILDEIDAEDPKIVALSRLRTLVHARDFMDWVQKRYVKLDVPGYERIFIRRDEQKQARRKYSEKNVADGNQQR